jgi:hypothetical protein
MRILDGHGFTENLNDMLTKEKDIIGLIKVIAITFVIGSSLLVVYQYTLTKDYRVVRIDDDFISKVKSTERLRGDTKVQLESGQKFILPFADNNNYQQYSLSQFVKPGDVLVKKSSSDTLIVKRYEGEFIFVMGKVIKENR